MQRRHRLTENAEFQRVRQRGRSYSHPLLVLYALRGEAGPSRAGISVGKRVGKAVTRNRVKRLAREALRALWPRIQPGWDFVLSGRTSAAGATYWQIREAVEQTLGRAGGLRRDVGASQEGLASREPPAWAASGRAGRPEPEQSLREQESSR